MIPTAEEIANEISMRYVSDNKPFILVEGDTDVLFIQCQTTVEIQNIIPTFGWERLVEAVQILQADGFLNILGIIDLDYRGVIASTLLPDSTFTTDSHDIETMMLNSPAFNKVLIHKASRRKLQMYPHGTTGVLKKIFKLGKLIGCLRFHSQKSDRNYSFKKMN
ncbi:unnamed protein product, partial [marine sediment metagenome]